MESHLYVHIYTQKPDNHGHTYKLKKLKPIQILQLAVLNVHVHVYFFVY